MIELALLPMNVALNFFSLEADAPHTHVLLPKWDQDKGQVV